MVTIEKLINIHTENNIYFRILYVVVVSDIPLQFCLCSMLSKKPRYVFIQWTECKKQRLKIRKTIYYKGL